MVQAQAVVRLLNSSRKKRLKLDVSYHCNLNLDRHQISYPRIDRGVDLVFKHPFGKLAY